MRVAELKKEVDALKPGELAELSAYIARRENRDAGADMGAAWDAVLGTRINDIEAGRAQGRPVADVVREMRAKYG
jgi:hypothetical protein